MVMLSVPRWITVAGRRGRCETRGLDGLQAVADGVVEEGEVAVELSAVTRETRVSMGFGDSRGWFSCSLVILRSRSISLASRAELRRFRVRARPPCRRPRPRRQPPGPPSWWSCRCRAPRKGGRTGPGPPWPPPTHPAGAPSQGRDRAPSYLPADSNRSLEAGQWQVGGLRLHRLPSPPRQDDPGPDRERGAGTSPRTHHLAFDQEAPRPDARRPELGPADRVGHDQLAFKSLVQQVGVAARHQPGRRRRPRPGPELRLVAGKD